MEIIYCSQKPTAGEARALEFLRNYLKDFGIILANFNLYDGRVSYEIDVLLVNRYGVSILEVKDWFGKITGDSVSWVRADGEVYPSPISSIDHKARVLKSVLKRENASWGQINTAGFVVVASEQATVSINDARKNRVFRLDQNLVAALETIRFWHKPIMLTVSKDEIRHIVAKLKVKHVSQSEKTIGSYRIIRAVESSQPYEEYEAQHLHIPGRRARIKAYTIESIKSRAQLDQRIAKFRREIDALTLLEGTPGFTIPYDFIGDPHNSSRYYLITEWVNDPSLSDILSERKFQISEQIKLIKYIANLVQAYHSRGIIHRNLHPKNIFIQKGDVPKIGNFDFAKIVGGAVTVRENLQTVQDIHYVSPEQRENPSSVDERTDLYSLGVIWYELFTGRRTESHPDLSGIKSENTGLLEILMRILAVNKEDRFRNVTELLAALEKLKMPAHSD